MDQHDYTTTNITETRILYLDIPPGILAQLIAKRLLESIIVPVKDQSKPYSG